MNIKNWRTLRSVLSIAFVLMYIIGMFLMLFSYFAQGLSLWFVSTFGGALLLYIKHKRDKRAADEAAIEEEERIYQENKRKQKEQENN